MLYYTISDMSINRNKPEADTAFAMTIAQSLIKYVYTGNIALLLERIPEDKCVRAFGDVEHVESQRFPDPPCGNI
jgi:hypothetical protein